MAKTDKVETGFKVEVEGPMCLSSATPNVMTWMAKSGGVVLGQVRLSWEHKQVAVLRDLEVSAEKDRWGVMTRLVGKIAEFVREHGILKLKVHRNSAFEWLGGLLMRLGFKDAASTKVSESTPMQFYLDLYHGGRRRGKEDTPISDVGHHMRLAV
jgi:hypothetical protein